MDRYADEAMYNQHKAWEREQEYLASEDAKAIANTEARETLTDEDRLLTDEQIMEATGAPMVLSGHRRLVAKTAAIKDAEYHQAVKKASSELADLHRRELEAKDAECQQRVEMIFKEIEDKGLFQNPEHIVLSGSEWQALKKSKE